MKNKLVNNIASSVITILSTSLVFWFLYVMHTLYSIVELNGLKIFITFICLVLICLLIYMWILLIKSFRINHE